MRILVVDDQRDFTDSFGALLQTYGHTVDVAYSPGDALKSALTNPPDVAFLDIGMPGMDGWALAEEMRTGQVRAYLVALTGFSSDADYARSKDAGLDLHLVKPIDSRSLEALLSHVEGMLQERGGAATTL